MASKRGTFDETQVPSGWFDKSTQPAGWFDGDLLEVASGGGPDVVSATDTASLTLSEVAALVVFQAAADTASLAASDAAAVTIVVAATDTASLALTESASVEEVAAPEETGFTASGGWPIPRPRKARKRREDDEDEPETIAPSEPPQAATSDDVERLRRLVAYYVNNEPADDLSRRAQRALSYAKAARSKAALALFERELRQQMEDEELAVALALALDD